MSPRTPHPTLANIVAASAPARKCVRKAADTGVPLEFFEDEEQCRLAYKRFQSQRAHANGRGIEWQLTFAQWWGVWSESGRWEQRGRRNEENTVMARDGDCGPYAVGNVRIATIAENFAESRQVRSGIPRKTPKPTRRPPVVPGSARGWTIIKGAKNPYMVKVAGKYVGSFPDAQTAEAAYREAAAVHMQNKWPDAETQPAKWKKPQKPAADLVGNVYLKDIAKGMTLAAVAKKHNKAGPSSIRMALKNAGLPTSYRELQRAQALGEGD